jgi:putative membrane protein
MKMEPLAAQWHFDPLIVLLTICLLYIYYLITGFETLRSISYFGLAILLLLLVTCSPLHFLGMHYYFSAHMIAHVVVLLLCGPLLVLGLQDQAPSLLSSAISSVSFLLRKYSWVGWLSGVGIMWFWHIPAVFDSSFAAMNHSFSFIPLLHAGTMLVGGMLFSWPLFSPYKSARLHPLAGIVYLFTACISCSLLGLLITFAPLNTYHHYMEMGAGPWLISRQADQQAAGLIMWVPCCFVYLSGCLFLLYRWFTEVSPAEESLPVKLHSPI